MFEEMQNCTIDELYDCAERCADNLVSEEMAREWRLGMKVVRMITRTGGKNNDFSIFRNWKQ